MNRDNSSRSIESIGMSDEEDPFQVLGAGVPIKAPEPTYMEMAEPHLIFEPRRQPAQPPSEDLQHVIGFAKFLKDHASPPNKRVTAGGRIVPAGPRSPPPTFQVEHIDTVLKNAEEKRKLQESQALWLEAKPQPPHIRSTDPYENSRISGPKTAAFEEPEPLSPGEQRVGNVRIPTSFKVIETINNDSVVVRAGNSYLYAALTENGEVSYQTVAVHATAPGFNIALNGGAPPQLAAYGQDGAHPTPSASWIAPTDAHGMANQASDFFVPPDLPSGTHWTFVQNQLSQSHQTTGTGSTLTPRFSFNSDSTAATSMSQLVPNDLHGGNHGSSQAKSKDGKEVQSSTIHKVYDVETANELASLAARYDELSLQLRELERHLAMNDMNMTPAEFETSMRRKCYLIETKDDCRRKREQLEAQPEAKSRINGKSDIPVRQSANKVITQKIHSVSKKRFLSPTAPAFVPSGLISDSSSPGFADTAQNPKQSDRLSIVCNSQPSIVGVKKSSAPSGTLDGYPPRPMAKPPRFSREATFSQNGEMHGIQGQPGPSKMEANPAAVETRKPKTVLEGHVTIPSSSRLATKAYSEDSRCQPYEAGTELGYRAQRASDITPATYYGSADLLQFTNVSSRAGPVWKGKQVALSPTIQGERIVPTHGTKGPSSSAMSCSSDARRFVDSNQHGYGEVASMLRSQLSNSEATSIRGGSRAGTGNGFGSGSGSGGLLPDQTPYFAKSRLDWKDASVSSSKAGVSWGQREPMLARLDRIDPRTQAISLYKTPGGIQTMDGNAGHVPPSLGSPDGQVARHSVWEAGHVPLSSGMGGTAKAPEAAKARYFEAPVPRSRTEWDRLYTDLLRSGRVMDVSRAVMMAQGL